MSYICDASYFRAFFSYELKIAIGEGMFFPQILHLFFPVCFHEFHQKAYLNQIWV